MAREKEKLFKEFEGVRRRDMFWDKGMQEELMERAFPSDARSYVLGMSGVVSAFYGHMLKQVGEQLGWDKIDPISKGVFHAMGKDRTRAAIDGGLDLPRDTRALALVFASAVYTSSPEYNFEVKEYTPEQTVLRIFGTSRYARIAKELNIDKHLKWPVLVPFFEGIAEQIGIECEVFTAEHKIEAHGECDYLARFTLSGRKYGDD